MGDAADDVLWALERAEADYDPEECAEMKDTMWTCRDGSRLLVSQMTDRHLHNCIAMILRNKNWRRQYLDRLQIELTIRSIQREKSK